MINQLKRMDAGVLTLIILFIILTPIFLTPIIHGSDGPGYYSYVRSMVIDGDVDLENELTHYKETYDYIKINFREGTGRLKSQYTVGAAIFWSPFFLLAHGLSHVFSLPLDGYSQMYVTLSMLGSAIYALIGLILLYKIAKDLVGKKIALISTLTVWLASHLFHYMYLQPYMSHAISFFAVSLFIWYWYFYMRPKNSAKLSWKKWVLLGVVAAPLLLVRIQNILYISIPLIYYIFELIDLSDWKGRIKSLLGPLLAAITFIILILPQLIVWKINDGHILGSYIGNYASAEGSSFSILRILFVLFSNKHGLFNWTPVFLLGAIGLYFLYKRSRQDKKLVLTLTVAIFLQLLVAASWMRWWGGYSYGNRYVLGTAVLLGIGFAYFMKKAYLYKKFLLWLIPAILIGWNFNLMFQYGSRMICPDCSASPLRILRNLVTELPKKAITILKKFLFDRGSLL